MELKTSSSFKIAGLLQPWQTLCKIYSKCLTTRVTGWDQPSLQIMQMMYCFVNNIHVDYAELLWEGLYYSLHHPTSLIPYPRFTKIIISHYMTCFPNISRRARDNMQDDDIMKNIFNSGRHKDKVGMQIPDWMLTEEMKHTEHYRMTPSAPRSPNPKMDATELSAPKRSTVIRFYLPERRSTHLTPPALMPTVDKADEMILQDTLQVSLAKYKSREEQEARENVELVNKHLASKEIEMMMERSENVIDDSLPPRNDEPNILGTRLEPRSDKESPEVEITNDEEVEIINVVIPVNVNDEEEEITDEVYKLKRREKGKIVEESRSTPFPTPIRSPRIHTDLVSSDTEKLQELTETVTKITPSSRSSSTKLSHTNRLLSLFKPKLARFKRYKNFFQELQVRYTYLFEHLKARFLSRKSFDTLADHLQEVMVESLHIMVDTHIKEQVKKQVREQVLDQVPVKQKEPGKPKEVIYSNSKIIQVIKTYWELGHEHKFITEIVARRANECIVSITEPDYKNLNKNDIEDMYLLIMNGKVPDYAETGLLWSLSVFIRSSVIWERVHDFQLGIESYQQKVNLTAPTISFPGVEKHKMFSIIYEPVHGIIYKNSKKEKRVMRHSEIHKFCDATLIRVLEGLKSYNNDVKYGYVQRELTNDEVEYLKLFEEEIEVSQPDEKMGDVCEWKTTWTTKGTPRIIDP
ncbi:hypothetical protein Tco_1129878 [Tanacetum coccineum]